MLAVAEKVLRDIARREDEAIKKRRSQILIQNYGMGYAVYDPVRNCLLSICTTQDGCDFSLEEVAMRYEDCERNTPWQKMVIASIKAGSVQDDPTGA